MNIAICDDNLYMTTRLESILDDCFLKDSNQYSCDVYLSGEELSEVTEREPFRYQIYILDVEMKEIDGFETAKRIRRQDQKAVIIFVTSHDELMPEAFEVNAFHFLVKPVDEEKAKQVFLKAIAAMEDRRTIFQFVIRKKTYTLYSEQIEFFESYGRKMIIHATDGREYEYYGTLKDAMNRVSERGFAQVHNSYIINMEHVHTADGEKVHMTSGMEIAITRKFHSSFQTAYRNYVLTQV